MDNSKIKVLMLIDNLACGGKERRLLSLLEGLKKYDNLEIELALIDDEVFYRISADLKIHVLKRNYRKDPFIFIKLYKLCKKIKPTILHSWGTMPTFYALPIIKILGIKFVNAEIVNALPHSSLMSKLKSKLTYYLSDIVVANSFEGLKVKKVPSQKAYCIHNGFDFNRLNNLESEEKVRNKFSINTKMVVGMIAAIYPKKDYITYLSAAKDITTRNKDVSFLVVGNGRQLEEFKQFTKGYNRVIYTGEQHDVESIINVMDVGVLVTNSTLAKEGISNSILEYMALGKPVIATKGGATSELVKEGETGFLIECSNPKILVERIEYLLNNRKIAQRMGNAGREVVTKDFSFERMVFETVKAYLKVAGIKQYISNLTQQQLLKPTL